MARGSGLRAGRVEKSEGLPAAIERALANRPTRLDALVTSDAIRSDAKAGRAWMPDLRALAARDIAERAWPAHPGTEALFLHGRSFAGWIASHDPDPAVCGSRDASL